MLKEVKDPQVPQTRLADENEAWWQPLYGWACHVFAPHSATAWLLAPTRTKPSNLEGCALTAQEPRRANLLEQEDQAAKARLDTLVNVELETGEKEVRAAEQALVDAQANTPAPIGLPVALALAAGEAALLCDLAAQMTGIPRSELIWELGVGQVIPVLSFASGLLGTTTCLAHEARFSTSLTGRLLGIAGTVGVGGVMAVARSSWAHVAVLSPETVLYAVTTTGVPYLVASIVGPLAKGWRNRWRARRNLQLAVQVRAAVAAEAAHLRSVRRQIAATFDSAGEAARLEEEGAPANLVRQTVSQKAVVQELLRSPVVTGGITVLLVLIAALAVGCTGRTPAATAIVVDTSESVPVGARAAYFGAAMDALDDAGQLRSGDTLLVATTNPNEALREFEVPRAFDEADPDTARRAWLSASSESVVSSLSAESDSMQMAALRRVGATLQDFKDSRRALVLVGDLADLRRGKDGGWFFETNVPSPERVLATLEKTDEVPSLEGVAVVACVPRPRIHAFSEAEEHQAIAVFTAVIEKAGGTFKVIECSKPALQRALKEVK